jgi:hypothetical protein
MDTYSVNYRDYNRPAHFCHLRYVYLVLLITLPPICHAALPVRLLVLDLTSSSAVPVVCPDSWIASLQCGLQRLRGPRR